MLRSRVGVLAVLALVAVTPAPSPAQAAQAGAAASASDLSACRTLVDASNATREAGDYAGAREKALEAVTLLLARPADGQDNEWTLLLDSAALAAYYAQDPGTASSAWRRLYEVGRAAVADDDPGLQSVRGNLAATLWALGDLPGARALQEEGLEVCTRTLPDDHPDLQAARGNLAATLCELGDLSRARALQEKVLEVNLRTLPDDHPALQRARGNLARTLRILGDLSSARMLREHVLEVESRTLPDGHPDLQSARTNLAATLQELGDLSGARALQERVLEVRARILPEDHPDLQTARGNLANTLRVLGDSSGARALQQKVLEVLARTLPDDHPDLQAARGNLAATLNVLGDLAGARALQEKVLDVETRTLPDDHPDLQATRGNLAATLFALGDRLGAQRLEQQVLDVLLRSPADDLPHLQTARLNLATTHRALGDLAAARALEERALEVFEHTLPDDHPSLCGARTNLAMTVASQIALSNATPGTQGDGDRERERCVALIDAACRAQAHAARAAILESPPREAEERCVRLARTFDTSLSFAHGLGLLEPLAELEAPSFVLAATMRGAALTSARLARRATHSPRYAELREDLRAASDALADLARKGTTSEEFDRARVRRESVERELIALARELSGGTATGVEIEVGSLAARLGAGDAAVSFHRVRESHMKIVGEQDTTARPLVRTSSIDRLCAFVVRSPGAAAAQDSGAASLLTLVDLGPIAPIESAVNSWRHALGVTGEARGRLLRESGVAPSNAHGAGLLLREAVFDPLLPALGGADRVVVVLDDVMHLVPLDALPLPDTDDLVGDRWRIETRATLTELLADLPAAGGSTLLALGSASFDAAPLAFSAEEARSLEEVADTGTAGTVGAEKEPLLVASVLRGTAWERGFTPLAHTGDEARGIGALYEDAHDGKRAAVVLERSRASRAALEELAPTARYLHIATHGWFAPESIPSWSDPQPIDRQSGLGSRLTGEEQVRGMSPMLLCGLALAGANQPADTVGRAPGLLTAEELSALDLSGCELVVLSACDTNVGKRRAGQGVASLQTALQMAGARSAITSLWKVPDEATKDLMLDFYRRLWIEGKPKHQALWEAKERLREARDERGAPRYTLQDWAGWVLTGEPD